MQVSLLKQKSINTWCMLNIHMSNCLYIFFRSIWERLLQMAADGKKTVIITTHYIEEARQAHTVI